MIHGAFVHVPEDASVWTAWTAKYGRADIFLTYKQFGDTLFWPDEMKTLHSLSASPMITIEPHAVSLGSIAAGHHDVYLREQAQTIAAFGSRVYIRFAHEMNGDWYSWCGDPVKYKAAYRYVRKVIKTVASNTTFVWCPNGNDDGRRPFSAYFPGNKYVDVFGVDQYNWGDPWRGLADMLRSSYAEFKALNPKRKIIVCETSSIEASDASRKANWIRNAYGSTQTKLPRIAGIIWFDHEKWRVDTSAKSVAAFQAAFQAALQL
jgi:hypothetical protein